MILYVCFDAFTSNWQSKLFKKHKVSKMQLMIANYISLERVIHHINKSFE